MLATSPLLEYILYRAHVRPTSGSWPFCLLYMFEAAAAFLSHQLRWQALLPPASLFLLFHIPLSLSSLLLTFSIICVSLFCSSHFSFPLSLSAAAHSVFVSCPYIPSSASPPPPPQPALSVCKMIAAVELLPTPGALMKAVLRWKQGERGTNCTLCTEQRQRTCLSMAGLNHVEVF